MPESKGRSDQGSQEQRESANREDEVKGLLDSYSKILDVWKVHNDNYFKRVQIFMGLLQVSLFLAAFKLLFPLPKSFTESLISVFLGILGILSASMWIGLNKKQSQYLEFCRRTLRNLESRLGSLGIPLEYFTTESLVFRHHREAPQLCSATTETVEVGGDKRHLLRFGWSQESYPESDECKGIYSITKVSGGMVSYEKRLAQIAICVWIFLIAFALFTGYIQPKGGGDDVRSAKIGMEAQPNKSMHTDRTSAPLRSADSGG